MRCCKLCVNAWDKRPQPRGAFVEAGLDVADTGNDQNAEALRSGPELFDVDRWYGSMAHGPAWTARKARKKATDNGCTRFYYDIGGPGAGIRDPLREDDPNDPDNPAADFPVQGCQFGSSPQSPDVPFVRGRDPKTNGEYFFNWAAQAGWALRMRADMTQRLVNGEDVDPHNCLFINPAIPKLQDVLAQLAQPEWDDSSGKLRIKKQPHEAGEQEPDSPDAYDAAIMAFCSDARRGLVSRD